MKNPLIWILIVFSLSCTPAKEVKDVATMSDEEVLAYANELAHKFIIVDGHVDLPYRMKKAGFMLKKEVMDVSKETDGNFDVPKSRAGGLDAPFMSIYIPSTYQVTGGADILADSLIGLMGNLTEKFPEFFALAGTPDDIKENFKKGLISLPMGMENGAPIGDDLANVKYFHDKGIRYITLTHATDNQICDSSYDTTYTWNGLSAFGEQVVAEMNRVGIMVDVSHISDSAFYDVMKVVKAPVIASHSSCRYYTPDFERNMNDDMIKALGANGGVIHINFGSTFLSKESRDRFAKMKEDMLNYSAEMGLKESDSAYQAYSRKYADDHNVFADVQIVADHVQHVVELIGIDHVAFGSDFDGVGNSLPVGLKDVSMYPNVIAELLKRGLSEEDIEKICYKNTFRVWNQVIEKAKELQGVKS